MPPSLSLEEVVLYLYDVKGIKFGSYTVRTGEVSPVYIDMRVIWSYPMLVRAVCDHLWEKIQQQQLKFDLLCGLPYQGIPLGTVLSTNHDIPMLLKRKKPKQYGTCQTFEGHFKHGDRILLVDDVVMTGATLVDDIPVFQKEGLEVVGTVAFFDRDQGGVQRTKLIRETDTFCVLTLPKAFEVLEKAGKVSRDTVEKTLDYLRTHRFDTKHYLEQVAPSAGTVDSEQEGMK